MKSPELARRSILAFVCDSGREQGQDKKVLVGVVTDPSVTAQTGMTDEVSHMCS